MNGNIRDLRRDYRRIEAPPHLVARIRAELADRRSALRRWQPAVAALAVAALVLAAIPMVRDTGMEPPLEPSATSLGMLARVSGLRPDVEIPGLSALRIPVLPPLPPKPETAVPDDTQSRNGEDEPLLKEYEHV